MNESNKTQGIIKIYFSWFGGLSSDFQRTCTDGNGLIQTVLANGVRYRP